mgnify:CR=1 FL=1
MDEAGDKLGLGGRLTQFLVSFVEFLGDSPAAPEGFDEGMAGVRLLHPRVELAGGFPHLGELSLGPLADEACDDPGDRDDD